MELKCNKCGFKFTQKSSLIRHSKLCSDKTRKAQNARQKSCRECSSAKTRCDLRRPICSRCSLRNTSCQYTTTLETSGFEDAFKANETSLVVEEPKLGVQTALIDQPTRYAPLSMSPGPSTLFLSDEHSYPDSSLINFADINVDGALSLIDHSTSLSILHSQATTPNLVRHSMELILRILRTWPRMMAKEIQLPPMIHPSQLSEPLKTGPLSNCITLSKMWHGQCPGATEIVQDTVKREMQELINTYRSMNEETLLAALQALSIYTLILLFPSNEQTALPLLDECMFRQLRLIIYHAATSGLVLDEETSHTRPTFEGWVHITTKRRAVLTLYLIHWSYSVYHCLPSFDCKELGFMPAPCAGYLWRETNKSRWEGLYTRWLAQWDGDDFYQWEFYSIDEGVRMGSRAEKWLEDADEFAMIFMAIVNASIREPEFETIHL